MKIFRTKYEQGCTEIRIICDDFIEGIFIDSKGRIQYRFERLYPLIEEIR